MGVGVGSRQAPEAAEGPFEGEEEDGGVHEWGAIPECFELFVDDDGLALVGEEFGEGVDFGEWEVATGGFACEASEGVDILDGVFGFESGDDDFECGGESIGGFGDGDGDAMDAGFGGSEAVLELSGLSVAGVESIWEWDG
jgi:hypothetical protein